MKDFAYQSVIIMLICAFCIGLIYVGNYIPTPDTSQGGILLSVIDYDYAKGR